ncbi:phage adaptor protein [Caedibacter taeniospiralis]|uniref:Uncharacterized protein n=1 Tax=Caedibacter taeniospiralis TaxID=28907 RepID=Q6TFH0_CAETA|nr:hypothetical protein [Caedibacter taeniospiralis]AAR87089.1 hypothetical protein [Caedibacter taeniospiralis]
MDAREIITQAASQSLGISPSDDDCAIYLSYLNQAHFELYNFTATVNPLATKSHQEVDLADGISADKLSAFRVLQVYDRANNRLLEPVSFIAITKSDPRIEKKGEPLWWFLLNERMHCYPRKSCRVGVWSIDRPQPFSLATKSEDIPYESSYQPLLIDGTAYRIYQNDSGMKNSSELLATLNRWQTGIRDFHGHLTANYHKPVKATFNIS